MERKMPRLVANAQKHLVPLVRMHDVARVHAHDQEMIRGPIGPNAVNEFPRCSHRRLGKIDCGLHQRVESLNVAIYSFYLPVRESDDDAATISVRHSDEHSSKVGWLDPRRLSVEPLILWDLDEIVADLLAGPGEGLFNRCRWHLL